VEGRNQKTFERSAHMKGTLALVGICLLVAAAANLAVGEGNEPKPGPLTGTWECVAHSSVQGDVPSTLKLEQIREAVSGTLTNSSGDYPLSSASYNKGGVRIPSRCPRWQLCGDGKAEAWPAERPLVKRPRGGRRVGVQEARSGKALGSPPSMKM